MRAEDVKEGLAAFIRERSGATSVTVSDLVRLSGGASRETWTFDATLDGAEGASAIEGIFRADPVAGAEPSPGRVLEYHSIKAAWDEGVSAPEPLWDGDDRFGVRFFTMRRVAGETLGARLIRGEQYAAARAAVPAQLAESLAGIHRISRESHPELLPLPGPVPGQPVAQAEVDKYEDSFRTASRDPHPVFELAFRWVREHMPKTGTDSFVHGDFRLGNFIFGENGLRGVIDWELAHWGDPMEDLGWVMVRSWRFGGSKPVAGVGEREPFFDAYEAAAGAPVDRGRVHFWELFGNLKWGVITISQAANYLDGNNRSVELASIGRRTAETEWELLHLLEQEPG